MAWPHYLCNSDALHEARRLRRSKPNCKSFENEWNAYKKYLSESNGIDEDYLALLLFLVNNAETEVRVTTKRRRENVIDIEEDEDMDGEYDPQYAVFLSKVKKFGKSYALEGDCDGEPVFVKYEGVGSLEDQEPQSWRMTTSAQEIYGFSNLRHDFDNDMAVEKQNTFAMQMSKEKSPINIRKSMNLIERRNGVEISHDTSNKKPRHKDNQLAQNPHSCAMQNRSTDKSKGVRTGKKTLIEADTELKNPCCMATRRYDHSVQAEASKKDNQARWAHVREVFCAGNVTMGKNVFSNMAKEDEVETRVYGRRAFRPRNLVKGNDMLSNEKTGCGSYCTARVKLEGDVQARSGMMAVDGKSCNVNDAICATVYKNSANERNTSEKGSDDDVSLEVEILDGAEFFKADKLSPFVVSKKFHESMGNKDESQQLGNPCMFSEFRENVLSVLGKPFDKDEYRKLREMVCSQKSEDVNQGLLDERTGSSSTTKKSYLDYHPDVKRKLKANRYNKHKCLTILRGFFFWLENLTKEEAFKPWLDRQCLSIEPKSQ